MNLFKGDSIPLIPELIYKKPLPKENYVLYNPYSENLILVLRESTAKVFSSINKKKTLNQIYNDLSKTGEEKISKADFKKVIKGLQKNKLIYFKSEHQPKIPKQKEPKGLTVWFHITNKCNLRCSYCYLSKSPQSMSTNTAFKSIDKILSSAKKHNFQGITFKFSGGECLIESKKILKVVEYAKKQSQKKGIQVRFSMLTNGTLIEPKIAKELKKYGFRVGVSLDGLGNFNDKFRKYPDKRGSFDDVMKGIDTLREYKVPFGVNTVVSNQNIKNLPEFTKYFMSKGINVMFSLIRETPSTKLDSNYDVQEYIEYLNRSLDIIYSYYPRINSRNWGFDRVDFRRLNKRPICRIGESNFMVRQDGKIATCAANSDRTIGSIEDEDLIDIIKKGDFTKGITVEEKATCKDCTWRYVCSGGCPLLTLNTYRVVKQPSPYCKIYKAIIPRILDLEGRNLLKYYEDKKST